MNTHGTNENGRAGLDRLASLGDDVLRELLAERAAAKAGPERPHVDKQIETHRRILAGPRRDGL